MDSVHLSRDADFDMLEVWAYIARNNLEAADRQAARFDALFQRLRATPQLGPSAEHLLPGLRRCAIGDYLVFYRVLENAIGIVRVLHGSRDITPELFE